MDATSDCPDHRRRVSLRLDGELSGFESVLLDDHLRRCASCRGFALGAESTTALLREAAHEVRSGPVGLRDPHLLRRRHTPLRWASSVAALAVVASLAVGHFGAHGGPSLSAQAYVQPSPGQFGNDDLNDLRALRRSDLVGSVARSWRPEHNVQFG